MVLDVSLNLIKPERTYQIFEALVGIARCDPAFYVKRYDFVLGVYYIGGAPNGGRWSTLIKALIDTPRQITITALEASQIPSAPGHNATIRATGGGFTWRVENTSESIVYVDVTDADGKHYLMPDTTMTKTVYMPLPLILLHELSHVYHDDVLRDSPTEILAREKQVRNDDNAFRAELTLPSIHPAGDVPVQHGTPTLGDLTFPACGSKKPRNPWRDCKKCAIATAALGSPVTRQIAAFRSAKRHFQEITLGSAPILAPMMNSYRLFSPRVADAVSTDPALRDSMRHYGVQAAVHLVKLVQALPTAASEPDEVVGRIERSLGAYATDLAAAMPIMGLGEAAEAALSASRQLARRSELPPISTRPPSCNPFASIVNSIQSSGADPEGPAWILEGLGMYMRHAVDWHHDAPGAARRLMFAAGSWLATVPLPRDAVLSEHLRRELNLIRAELLFDVIARKLLMRRLIDHWPDSAVLRAVLETGDFLSSDDASRSVSSCQPI
jgi:hypothetical protein